MHPQYPDQQALKDYEAFVICIISYLVDDFDGFSISSTVDDRGIFINLAVPEKYLGQLIGKKGVTIEAVKTLLHCYGRQREMRLSLKLVPADKA